MKTVLASIILLLFSCNSSKKSAQSDMKEFPSGKYEVLELKAEKYNPKKTYTININTEEQRIGGTFDCNTFSCEYEKNGNNLEFGFAVATKMYCEGNMHNENAFMGKLRILKSFEYDGEILKLFNEDNQMILKLKKVES
jgi:heat shock protein HslJ